MATNNTPRWFKKPVTTETERGRLYASKLENDRLFQMDIDARNRQLATLNADPLYNRRQRMADARERVGQAERPGRVIVPYEVEIHGRKYKPDLRSGQFTGKFVEVLTDEEKFLKKEFKNIQRKVSSATKATAALELAKKATPLSEVEALLGLIPSSWTTDGAPQGYRTLARCGTPPGPVNAGAGYGFHMPSVAQAQSVMCLSGQPGGPTGIEDALRSGAATIIGGYQPRPGDRMVNTVFWQIAYPGEQPDIQPNPFGVAIPFGINANRLRRIPANFSRSVPRQGDSPSAETSPQSATVVQVGPAGARGLPPTYTATKTARPGPNTREGKSGATKAILGVVDVISESTEVVDCFYKALPDATKKRWDAIGKKIEKDPSRGPYLDQAGQYGINGADWKSRALWHNWHNVDFSAAMKCVAVNEIEDRLYGFAQKHKDRVSRARNFKKTLRGR